MINNTLKHKIHNIHQRKLNALINNKKDDLPIKGRLHTFMKYLSIDDKNVKGNTLLECHIPPFYVSRKFNGWYTIWDGINMKLYTVNGSYEFKPPDFFINRLPKNIVVHGELVIIDQEGRDHSCLNVLFMNDMIWENTEYHIFSNNEDTKIKEFKNSYEFLQDILPNISDIKYEHGKYIYLIRQHKFEKIQDLDIYYKEIVDNQCEGIVLSYGISEDSEITRFKVRARWISNATIMHVLDNGLNVVEDGYTTKTFNIYLGFDKTEKSNLSKTFKISNRIKFSYSVRYMNHTPSFPRYIRSRSIDLKNMDRVNNDTE